jgi:glycosyltransferase involved in cell wall biosynthesis
VIQRVMKPLTEARIALVNEWLVRYVGGYERVIANLYEIFPEADHFALVHDPKGFQGSPLEELNVQTSFIQALPGAKRNYQRYLPLMPLAVERFDLSAYDIVISTSHAVAKGVITSPEQLHICYLQARNLKYAYEDRFFYPRNALSGVAQDFFLSKLRVWDGIASRRPDFTVANSYYVSNWHLHRHGLPASVIYPPVDATRFAKHFQSAKDEYYVTVGRLEPYKRMDLIVKAFNSTGLRLVIIGDGSMLAALKRMSSSSNIEFLGHRDTNTVARVIAKAKAFVFASREDFGIAPLEAQACGTPVIAYNRGGASETVIGWPAPGATGLFFEVQSPKDVEAAVRLFESQETAFAPEACRHNAERFNQERFQREFSATVEELWGKFQRGEGLK